MLRFLGITFGLLTQAVFLATLPSIYRFLRNDYAFATAGSLWIDAGLALQFVLPHSILLYPKTRAWITRRLRSEFYGSLFCLATCVGLSIQFAFWRGSPFVVWAWPESLRPVIRFGFLACWVALFYSLFLTGLGYQTGLTPWWHWLRRRPLQRRQFHPIGAYRYLRHPAYFSFLGLVWLTPVITADRAVLIVVWSAYIYVGSYLKDQRLAKLIGEPYERYMTEVPGYPLITWGPLARRPLLPLLSFAASTSESRGVAESARKAA